MPVHTCVTECAWIGGYICHWGHPFSMICTLYLLACQMELPKAIQVVVLVSIVCRALLFPFVCCSRPHSVSYLNWNNLTARNSQSSLQHYIKAHMQNNIEASKMQMLHLPWSKDIPEPRYLYLTPVSFLWACNETRSASLFISISWAWKTHLNNVLFWLDPPPSHACRAENLIRYFEIVRWQKVIQDCVCGKRLYESCCKGLGVRMCVFMPAAQFVDLSVRCFFWDTWRGSSYTDRLEFLPHAIVP